MLHLCGATRAEVISRSYPTKPQGSPITEDDLFQRALTPKYLTTNTGEQAGNRAVAWLPRPMGEHKAEQTRSPESFLELVHSLASPHQPDPETDQHQPGSSTGCCSTTMVAGRGSCCTARSCRPRHGCHWKSHLRHPQLTAKMCTYNGGDSC